MYYIDLSSFLFHRRRSKQYVDIRKLQILLFSSLFWMKIEMVLFFQLNIHKFKCVARFGLMHVVVSNICVWMRTLVKECTKEIAQFQVRRGHGVSEDYMILGNKRFCLLSAVGHMFCLLSEGYNTLRRKFGDDSFLVNGPYAAIMSAIYNGADGVYNSNPFNIFSLTPDEEGLNDLNQPQSLIANALATSAPYASAQVDQVTAPYFYSPTAMPPPPG